MTTYRVRITKQAQGHLTEIRRYIEQDLLAPDSALRIIRSLRNEMKSLTVMPYRYPAIHEEPWYSEGIRKTQVNNYYIYDIFGNWKSIPCVHKTTPWPFYGMSLCGVVVILRNFSRHASCS